MPSMLWKHSKKTTLFLFLAIFVSLCLTLILLRDTKITHIYVSSAYYVTDTTSDGETTRNIRMIALGENDIKDLPLWCNIDGQPVKALVKHLGGPHQCKFATYFIECLSNVQPTNFVLVGPNQLKHNMQLNVPDSKPRKLVVCFSRMFLYEKWQIAVAALNLYKLHGVDLMVIPISSVIDKLYAVLKAYEQEGSVRLKPAVHIPKFPDLDYDPNAETEWFQQIAAYTECLYDYRESAEFILNVDVDDLIIPKNFESLYDELDVLATRFPNAASFEFRWATTEARGSNYPAKFSISQMMKESNIHKEISNYGKSVIRPKYVNRPYIHFPGGDEILRGFEHQLLTENDALAVHFRHLVTDGAQISNTESYFSNRTIYTHIDHKFKQFLEQNPIAKAAYLELPTQYYYLPSMIDCYLNIGSRLSTNNLDFCPNPLQCSPNINKEMPKCVVLSQHYYHTQLSANLHIATAISSTSNFQLRVNCLV